MRGGKIAGLESLSELGEERVERSLGRILRRLRVMMMVVMGSRDRGGLLLQVGPDVGVVLLRGGEIAGLKIGRELLEG